MGESAHEMQPPGFDLDDGCLVLHGPAHAHLLGDAEVPPVHAQTGAPDQDVVVQVERIGSRVGPNQLGEGKVMQNNNNNKRKASRTEQRDEVCGEREWECVWGGGH